MKTAIIAAGLGSRLVGKGELKPLIPLNGIPLIERVVKTHLDAGITGFVVVVGYKKEKLKPYLKVLETKYSTSINIIENSNWQKPNGLSVLTLKKHFNEAFILTMTDHMYNCSLIKKLKNTKLDKREVFLASDFNIDNNPYVDIDDVTKVQSENGFIKNIGKELIEYNAFDAGVFLCSPFLFSALEESIASGDESLSGGMKVLGKTCKARTLNISGELWVDVDDENAFKKAEKLF